MGRLSEYAPLWPGTPYYLRNLQVPEAVAALGDV